MSIAKHSVYPLTEGSTPFAEGTKVLMREGWLLADASQTASIPLNRMKGVMDERTERWLKTGVPGDGELSMDALSRPLFSVLERKVLCWYAEENVEPFDHVGFLHGVFDPLRAVPVEALYAMPEAAIASLMLARSRQGDFGYIVEQDVSAVLGRPPSEGLYVAERIKQALRHPERSAVALMLYGLVNRFPDRTLQELAKTLTGIGLINVSWYWAFHRTEFQNVLDPRKFILSGTPIRDNPEQTRRYMSGIIRVILESPCVGLKYRKGE